VPCPSCSTGTGGLDDVCNRCWGAGVVEYQIGPGRNPDGSWRDRPDTERPVVW
jgi:hypothetical protein